jgi:hypothetical protein
MDTKVAFEGRGPYRLPDAQRVSASGSLNEGITITFLADVHGSGNELAGINVRIPAEEALLLCRELLRAIDDALGQNTGT